MTEASATAPGETRLTTLLTTLQPYLHPETFVFMALPSSYQAPPPSLQIQMWFREAEGLTVITTLASAVSHPLEFTFPCRMITLNVRSSLEAVGFIEIIATKLKERRMGVNPVSGYFHDHLFVPVGREDEALEVLHDIAINAKTTLEGGSNEERKFKWKCVS